MIEVQPSLLALIPITLYLCLIQAELLTILLNMPHTSPTPSVKLELSPLLYRALKPAHSLRFSSHVTFTYQVFPDNLSTKMTPLLSDKYFWYLFVN